MRIIKGLLASVLFVFLTCGCTSMQAPPPPPGTLNAAEVTALFSGKTVESRLDKSGRISLTYYHPTGELRQLQKGLKRSGKWRVTNNGRICLQLEGEKESCRVITQEGGTYYKYIVKKDGNHQRILTYTSFRSGNLVDEQ